ncbi:MAG: RagB/SusD family nutrient uptake outer membrane protein [Massilibacteroides sp.]|nr:RagB/SusD family nutrient uptake outer membrane protein [Massilibacteroides sp.]MDD3063778.1 RagB/SusD family nutrient uptake outer membrane protein [Massilibacteroides sp.]MDD4115404.1 RagB/SusD family nutrient uptake outer membrane protein [Massilibacteroides sp.]MDD4660915.1 RagB/SusD family nutrient uptake outer membrane protein [Massilibacteroides sp.]
MKLKKIFAIVLSLLGTSVFSSCDDFFDLYPKDQLTPSTFWKTSKDADAAVTAAYEWWVNNYLGSKFLFYEDCMSDIGFNYTNASNFKMAGNGAISSASTPNYYQYENIRRCNFVIGNIDKVPSSELLDADKKDMLAQVRAIRAYHHAYLATWYGDAVIMDFIPESAAAAQLPREPEAKVKEFAMSELNWCAQNIAEKPSAKGRIAKGTVFSIIARFNLLWGNYSEALNAANQVIALGQYELDPDFLNMFSMYGQDSKEIIYSYQHIKTTSKYSDVIRFYNNADGGWASFVPTQNLVDMFEMANGKAIDEGDSGYDPAHPFYNRDPRLKNTVIYSGLDWVGRNNVPRIFNTIDKTLPNGSLNNDYYIAANNASHTGMLWAKYLYPNQSQYSTSMNDDALCPIIFRYAETLLTKAECLVELNQNLTEALDIIDQLRLRGGHIAVDRTMYTTQAKIRELVRRERTIELAGEGFRYEDIVRWDDYDANGNKTGKKVAEVVMPGDLLRLSGTVDYDEPNPNRRVVINLNAAREDRLVEVRYFNKKQLHLPIPQTEMDANPQLVQNEGY